jgi:hypothetical protein
MTLDYCKNLLLKTPSDRRRQRDSLLNYAPELRGPPNNRFGGHQAQSLSGFKGGTYGAAGPVREFTPEEIKKWEREQEARKFLRWRRLEALKQHRKSSDAT